MKIRMTVVYEYEPVPDDYKQDPSADDPTVEQMAAIDQQQWDEGVMSVEEFIGKDIDKVVVTFEGVA